MSAGETPSHASLKLLALEWAVAQGFSFAAPEVSFPHRRYRVDVAACCPVRKVPARRPVANITTILKAAAVFECKQARSDLVRDNARREAAQRRLKELAARRTSLESLLHLHLPHLANGESLFPEFDSYRLRPYRHAGYRRLVRHIDNAQSALLHKTKFDRLRDYGVANLHYLVVEESLLAAHEVPQGWGLLVRRGNSLELAGKPQWQEIHVEHQLVFLQRIAARKAWQPPLPCATSTPA
jgi:hypothetical protein